MNCFNVLPVIADTKVDQEMKKKKDTIYCVLKHNKCNLLKFALQVHTASRLCAKTEAAGGKLTK